MSNVSNNDIALACYIALDGKSSNERISTTHSIVEFMSRKRLFTRSPEILLHLEKIINKENGVLVVKVKSAQPLGQNDKEVLIKTLKKHYTFEQILFKEEIDSGLIGGIRLEIGDEVIDLSIKDKIKKLQAHLTTSTK